MPNTRRGRKRPECCGAVEIENSPAGMPDIFNANESKSPDAEHDGLQLECHGIVDEKTNMAQSGEMHRPWTDTESNLTSYDEICAPRDFTCENTDGFFRENMRMIPFDSISSKYGLFLRER